MELGEQDFLSDGCERPQHVRVDRWYVNRATRLGVELWSELGQHEIHELKQRKSRRRIEEWWRKPTDPAYYSEALFSERLAEAKRQQFTAKGKQERVAKSLAALSQPPYIRLTANEWRQIVEDPDLEDQFS